MIMKTIRNLNKCQKKGKQIFLKVLILLFILIIFSSCTKNVFDSDWLDAKRDKNLLVPTTLKDMRDLLNNTLSLGYDYKGKAALLMDDYYLSYSSWVSSYEVVKNSYIWEYDGTEGGTQGDTEWNGSYEQVFYSNVILEGLEKITPDNTTREEWKDVKGGALYFRAKAFYNLVQLYAPAYDESTADTDLGIHVRLTADVNASITRQSVAETYERIIADMKEAIPLLRESPSHKVEASKAAAYGMLARIYLSMRKYDLALEYANLCLGFSDVILDFNTLNSNASYPLPAYNDEVIIQHVNKEIYLAFINIDNTLYDSYSDSDLRLSIFFRNYGSLGILFRGNHTGSFYHFAGITTGEMYLIKAECLARNGNTSEAMSTLNALLVKRYEEKSFISLTASDANEALTTILWERRKELLFRGLRWSDLKRLNKEPEFAVTISRNLDGQIYTLPPNDLRYVLPIPNYVIQDTGIPQNPR